MSPFSPPNPRTPTSPQKKPYCRCLTCKQSRGMDVWTMDMVQCTIPTCSANTLVIKLILRSNQYRYLDIQVFLLQRTRFLWYLKTGQGERAPTLGTFAKQGLLVAIFDTGYVKFGLREPDWVIGCDIYHGLESSWKFSGFFTMVPVWVLVHSRPNCSIHSWFKICKIWKFSSPHSPLPDYMLGVLITPNRVEELTCIELIWRWHVYLIEGCSITFLFESIPLNQFLSRTFIEKVGGGLGHLYLWLSTLAIFTLWNDMQCERRGPLSDSISQSGLELNKLSSWLL
jgi:hypothetical protein